MVAFFVKNCLTFYTFRSFVWVKSGIITLLNLYFGVHMAKSKILLKSRIDYSILLPVLILLLVGLVSIFIATNFDYPKNLVQVMSQQVLWIFLGSVLAFVVMLFNTEFLWKITPWLYIFGLGLMVSTPVFYSPAFGGLDRGKKLGQY